MRRAFLIITILALAGCDDSPGETIDPFTGRVISADEHRQMDERDAHRGDPLRGRALLATLPKPIAP